MLLTPILLRNYSVFNFMVSENNRLIRKLEALGYLRDIHVREAFAAVPRGAFVPPSLLFDAYRNIPLVLPDGGMLSQPIIFSFILDQSFLQQGNRVLFFDTGAGWEANVIASLVSLPPEIPGTDCLVFAVEPDNERIATAKMHSEQFPFLGPRILEFFPEDAAVLQYAPFDRIISIRKTKEGIPDRWRELLAIGGRIVMPLDEHIIVLEKKSPGVFEEKKFFGFHFPE